jgi:flagellar biosynthesis protein FlhF
MDIHLVLSATTKYRDATDVITRFNQLLYNKIIITKLDETNTVGPLLSVLGNGKKLSYFTTGQSVPDDIEIARKEKLYELISFDLAGVRSSA